MLKGASVADWRSVQPAKTAKASAAEGWAKERFPWSEAVRMNWVKRRALEALPLKRPELRERPVGGNLKKKELAQDSWIFFLFSFLVAAFWECGI